MRIVVALGGNALLRRGQQMTAEQQRENVRTAAVSLAPLARSNELVVSHGNGPQVGLLALQAESYRQVEPYPLDVLGAQSEGMIGYMIEQELGNVLPEERPIATVLTMVEVDPSDEAFQNPRKPIGPGYEREEAERMRAECGWSVARDGDLWRRVVASPLPVRIFEIKPIRWLLERGTVVICAGGGGVPTMFDDRGKLVGAQVVVDKDRASSLLAVELEADALVMATDVDGVYAGWGGPDAERLGRVTPDELRAHSFETGSMGPKVEAACSFVERTGGLAAIGALEDVCGLAAGEAGTVVAP